MARPGAAREQELTGAGGQGGGITDVETFHIPAVAVGVSHRGGPARAYPGTAHLMRRQHRHLVQPNTWSSMVSKIRCLCAYRLFQQDTGLIPDMPAML